MTEEADLHRLLSSAVMAPAVATAKCANIWLNVGVAGIGVLGLMLLLGPLRERKW